MSTTLCFLLPSLFPVQGDAARIEWSPREVAAGSVTYTAEVGRLAVPENRAREDSSSIRLAVLRLKATTDEPGPPLLFLPGGPGNPATTMAGSPVWARFLELGDVVLMDPRGVGRSEPDLFHASPRLRPELVFGDRETAVGHILEICEEAAGAWAQEGIDISGYHAIEMSDDLEALRRALGAEQVNLLGHSFGTHLGLAYLRRYPGRTARFVSAGTAGTGDMHKLPSELDASLATLGELFAEDPALGEALPDLLGAFAQAVESLDEEPLPVPLPGDQGEVLLGPFGLQLVVLAELGYEDMLLLPRLVHTVLERDASVAAHFVAKRMRMFSKLPGLLLVVRGASGASAERWERIRSEGARSPFGTARCLFSPESDAVLGVHDVGDPFRAPVQSDVPTLFVSGSLDGHTPPHQAERARLGFARAGHVIVEYANHEALLPDPEVQAHILDFLAGGEPEDAFLARPRPRFATLEGPAPGFEGHPALR